MVAFWHFHGFHVVGTTTTGWFMDETAEGQKKFRLVKIIMALEVLDGGLKWSKIETPP